MKSLCLWYLGDSFFLQNENLSVNMYKESILFKINNCVSKTDLACVEDTEAPPVCVSQWARHTLRPWSFKRNVSAAEGATCTCDPFGATPESNLCRSASLRNQRCSCTCTSGSVRPGRMRRSRTRGPRSSPAGDWRQLQLE